MDSNGLTDIVKRSQCTGLIIQKEDDLKGWDPATRDGFNWILTRERSSQGSSLRSRVMAWSDLSEAAREARIPPLEKVRPEDPAAIIYTSGTTGRPKGLSYSHGQFCQVRRTLAQAFNGVGPKDLALSWLPLSNLFQRIFNLVAMELNVPCVYLSNPRDIMSALSRVRPTLLIGVPRFFEKGRQGVLALLPRPAQWILNQALRFTQGLYSRRRKGLPVGMGSRIVSGMLDFLIYRWLRRVWGGAVEVGDKRIGPLFLRSFEIF
jgi:long-chain acyl-CoA synthetase